MMKQKAFRFRGRFIAGITAAVLLLFLGILYDAQIRNGIDLDESTAANTVVTQAPVEAARGEITDRNGKVLVTNETVYQVVLDVDAMGDYARQTATVRRLLELCREAGITPDDGGLPVTWKGGGWKYVSDEPFAYTDENGETAATRFARLCEEMEWPMSADDAGKTAEAMLATFGLSGREDEAVLDVLYACYLREKEILFTTWYLAEDVDIGFITAVKEERLPGVELRTSTRRVYETPYAAHLLGQVGAISAENWETGENYKERGYAMDAVVGISGAEYAFEDYLQGSAGIARRITNLDGTLLSQDYAQLPEAGDTVMLTIDIDLQAAAEQALSAHTEEINAGEGGSAVVVMDVRDGSVLAAASYPTFDLATYREAYRTLVQDEKKPLFNRAFLGTYAPGSTYKIVTATAALDTGLITTEDTIRCDGKMEYLDTTFHCWIYRQSGGRHGEENVSDALRDSCNIFFYTIGSELGIETLTEYARAYGLGLPTGIELSESVGVNAGPEYSQRIGTIWYPGNTLSSAIGQSDNQFTPLQICNYIATVVNGGDRYAAHLLRSVRSYDGTETVYTYTPEIQNTVSLSEADRAAILQGMAEVTESSTDVREAFADLTARGISVGAKTGSAQVSGQENANGMFVCFAPLDDPQIAVCVAVEKGGSGAATSVIAADILSAYFADKAPLVPIVGEAIPMG